MTNIDRLEKPGELDQDALRALLDSLEDELDAVTNRLMVLERDPTNREALNALFRSIHSIKGNCKMCALDPLADFVHAIEDSLSEVRGGRMSFSPQLREAVLLSLDQLKNKVDELNRGGACSITAIRQMIPLYSRIRDASPQDAAAWLGQIINLGGGSAVADLRLDEAPTAGRNLNPRVEFNGNVDMRFFRSMGELVDAKCPYWTTRTDTQLAIALGINKHLRNPVDSAQLAAAVCLHDLGMAFLPGDLVNKAHKFNLLEEKQIRQHVQWSHEWIKRLPDWSRAALMVRQHHERPDGKGYPDQLTGDAINDGAQIIAVADTFFSVTNERSDRTHKKSLLRAITEINAHGDLQFKRIVIDAFNALMREIYSKQLEVVPTAAARLSV
jgi:HPt (histidine-containing phosphotransfer) domain-containing protein